MGKDDIPRFDDGFVPIDLDRKTIETFKYLKQLDKRMKAFKRMYTWAMTKDLYDLVVSKIPSGKRYGKLLKSLKIGELQGGDVPIFAVYIDNKAKGIKKIDGSRTVVYVRDRKIPTRIKPEIKLLIDKGPWTVDTIPFWPSKKDAVVIQRKVDKRTVEKIEKLQEKQKGDIRESLIKLGQKNVDMAVKSKAMGMAKAKAVPDVVYEMMSLEFGGGSQKPLALWRSSQAQLKTKSRTILSRYKNIYNTLYDIKYMGWRKYPTVTNKVKISQISAGKSFMKQIGL